MEVNYSTQTAWKQEQVIEASVAGCECLCMSEYTLTGPVMSAFRFTLAL